MKSIPIPQNDAAFNQFFREINQYIAAKTAGAVPEWRHIPAVDRIHFTQMYLDWYSAYLSSLNPHYPKSTKDTSRARAIAEHGLSEFALRFLSADPVNELDRLNMGIPNCGQAEAPHIEVNDAVELEFRLRNLNGLLLDFWRKSTASNANQHSFMG